MTGQMTLKFLIKSRFTKFEAANLKGLLLKDSCGYFYVDLLISGISLKS